MDYIITNSELQTHTSITPDWTSSASYQLKFTFIYKK
jgi:hypothetical protein